MALRVRSVASLVVFTFFFACLRVSAADAQTAGVPPDLVRMKNGGMLRGTIVELVPGGEVTVVGADGQTRKLPMSDVSYAGPAAGDPAAAPTPAPPPAATPPTPYAPPSPPPAPFAPPPGLRLVSDDPGLTFHYLAGSSTGTGVGTVWGAKPGFAVATMAVNLSHYTRLCTAPCTTNLEPGSYTFALERPNEPLLEAPAISIRGGEQLKGTITSRSAVRWSLFAIGAAATVAGILVGMKTTQNCSPYYMGPDPSTGRDITLTSCTDDYPNIVPGTILLSVGVTMMLIPLLIRDKAEVVATGL